MSNVSPDRNFISSTLRIGLSGAGAQSVLLLSLPFLSRLYSPESFGEWSIIQSVALLIGTVATCRYELAVVLPKDEKEAIGVLASGLMLTFIVTLSTAIYMRWIGGTQIVNGSPKHLYYWAVPSLVFFGAAIQLSLAWCTRVAAFSHYGVAQLSLAALSGILPAAFVVLWGRADGLVLGAVTANVLVGVSLWVWILRKRMRRDLLRCISFIFIIKVGVKYRAYPFYMTPYTLLSTLRERAILFMIGNFASVHEVGLYSVAQRLANAPNSLVASALRPVFFQYISQNQNQGVLSDLIEKVIYWLVAIAIPPAVFFYFNSEFLLELMFGQEWAKSAGYLMVLAVPMLPLLLGNWMDRVFDVLGLQRLAFIMELVFSVLAIGVTFVAFKYGATAIQAVFSQALVMTIYFIVWIVVLFYSAQWPMQVLWRTVKFIAGLIVIATLAISGTMNLLGITGQFAVLLILWFYTIRYARKHR